MPRPTPAATTLAESFPPLPLTPLHWQAVVQAMHLSPQQARIVALVVRGLCDKQIASVLGISEPTVRTYLQRIAARTHTHGRMELALRVLAVSHEVTHSLTCRHK